MIANINVETGIRYGVVKLYSLADWVYEEFFNDGTNVTEKAVVDEWEAEHPDADEDERQAFFDELEIDEPAYELEKDGMKLGLSYLGGAPLVWVFESPVIETARECSPCCPNAGDLDSKDTGGFDCYSLPADWWGLPNVKLGTNLASRVTAYHVVSLRGSAPRIDYLAALVRHQGQRVEVERAWNGTTGLVYAYNLRLNGKLYHVPALFVEDDRTPPKEVL